MESQLNHHLLQQIQRLGADYGFHSVGVAATDLGDAVTQFQGWLAADYHGEMTYMADHGSKRWQPAELVPGTRSIISATLPYLPERGADQPAPEALLGLPDRGYISRYALGRDYHKLFRKRLQHYAEALQPLLGPFNYRVFVDSAPVLERPIAIEAGLGWMGKHTLTLTRSGSWFFLGEIYTDLALPTGQPIESHCGYCDRCISICPTQAIVAPYQLDARRCISYLTIELKGVIPKALRPLIGNRIYGCDDCQLVCPWNRFATTTQEADFLPRHGLDNPALLELISWDEATFNQRTEGMPLRRLGFERWQRNIVVALGNSGGGDVVRHALEAIRPSASLLVQEHIIDALVQLGDP